MSPDFPVAASSRRNFGYLYSPLIGHHCSCSYSSMPVGFTDSDSDSGSKDFVPLNLAANFAGFLAISVKNLGVQWLRISESLRCSRHWAPQLSFD